MILVSALYVTEGEIKIVTDQSLHMIRLIFAFVVCKQHIRFTRNEAHIILPLLLYITFLRRKIIAYTCIISKILNSVSLCERY